tara:strand:+ start:429 stop:1331 length:903 start_codon:yes stop_codon:yes gene_type:complete
MFNIFGFYKFKNIKNLKKNKKLVEKFLLKKNIRGTLILSSEGLNGTLSGKNIFLLEVKRFIKKNFLIKKFDSENSSKSLFNPFHRLKIKIKKEVVPMGFKVFSYKSQTNKLNPCEWNSLLKNKNTHILDVRKPFEYSVGTFKKSINPNIENFRDFTKYFKNINKNENVAMFCTGGIRCEKASLYLKNKGFKNIYQLNGGIINYLNKTDKRNSLWKGELYVFDNRVSIKHNLKQGTFSMCSGCRKPVSTIEKKSSKYVEGISCPKCHDFLTTEQKLRFAMRQKQILIAKKSGKKHIFQKEY